MLPLLGVAVDELNIYISLGALIGLLSVIVRLAWGAIRARDTYLDLLREHREDRAKLETIWSAQLSRGKVEGEKSGHMIFATGSHSISDASFRLSLEAWDRFAPIRPGLRLIGRRLREASDSALTLAIESEFGRWIVDEVCRPLGLKDMSCLLMACRIARSPEGESDSAQVIRPTDSCN